MELINKKPFNELPSRKNVINFLKEVRKIIFPGYFEEIKGDIYEYIQLKIQNAKELFLNDIINDKEKCDKFFYNLYSVEESLKTDVEMTYISDPACESNEEIIIAYPGLFAISTYRIAHELYLLDIPVIPRIMSEYAHSKTGIDIHPGAKIGNYFFIDHGTGIVIGETTIIGHHVKIYHGVTLGALSLKKGQNLKGKKRHPTVGNYVTIYSGASVLGGDTIIGNNVTLGCNVYVMQSIPDNSKVVVNISIEK